MPSHYFNKAQSSSIKKLTKQGFAHVTNGVMGAELQRINADGYVEKRTVDIFGRVKIYLPWKPSPREKASLSKLKEKYQDYGTQKRRKQKIKA